MPRVLLIDDTPEIAELLTFALRDHGYEVFATGYTTSVNELLIEQRADALVLDCTSFDMSEALLDSVRSDPKHARIPGRHRQRYSRDGGSASSFPECKQSLMVRKPFTGAHVATALALLA